MRFFGNNTINRIYLHSALYMLSDNVGYVFIYAYLLKAGVEAPLIICSIAASVMCRFLWRLTVVPLVKRIGIRNGLIFGTAFDASGYFILMFVEELGPLYFFFIVYASCGNAFYWTCYHAFVARLGDEQNRGSQVSMVQAFNSLTGIAAPLIGTALILAWGAPAAFLAGGLICAAGILPLIGTPNPQIAKTVVLDPAAIQLATGSFFADGMIAATTIFIWLIALFDALGQNFGSFGLAISFASLAGAIMSLGVGRLFDLGHHNRSLQIAYLMFAAVIVAKAFGSTNALGAVAANALAAMAGPLYLAAINSRVYNIAKTTPCTLRFHVYAEGAFDIGAALSCLAAAAILALGYSFFWPIMFGLLACALGYYTLRHSSA